jgi:hypothetical protein
MDMKIKITDALLDLVFEDLDENGDGELSFEEIKEQIAQMVIAFNTKYEKFVYPSFFKN